MCVTQTVRKFPFGCFDVLVSDPCEMTYEEFKAQAEMKATENINEAEDMFWSQITKDRVYSINNSFSLFGEDTKVWNLDQFTKDESCIHLKTVPSPPQSKCTSGITSFPFLNFISFCL